jgi:hypothetical protein
MLGRIRELLDADGESAELLTVLTELCPDCRGLAAF